MIQTQYSTLVLTATLLTAVLILSTASPVPLLKSNHTSNWAVLVSTSRYWLNYRHSSNVLSIYRTVKRLGIPDSNIILMLSDDAACNPRNYKPAQIFNNESHALDVYGQDVEVDYRGYEVTVENFMRVLTGRHDPAVPRSKRLMSDAGSNILVFFTGHGGDNFVKFQDVQELMGEDLQDALQQMHEKGRYNEVLVMVETCEAASVVLRIKAPNVLAVASSLKGESSWSYKTDMLVGQSLVDRFTLLTLQFAERLHIDSAATLQQLFDTYDPVMMDAHSYVHRSKFRRPPASVRVTDFFGSVAPARALQVPKELILEGTTHPDLAGTGGPETAGSRQATSSASCLAGAAATAKEPEPGSRPAAAVPTPAHGTAPDLVPVQELDALILQATRAGQRAAQSGSCDWVLVAAVAALVIVLTLASIAKPVSKGPPAWP